MVPENDPALLDLRQRAEDLQPFPVADEETPQTLEFGIIEEAEEEDAQLLPDEPGRDEKSNSGDATQYPRIKPSRNVNNVYIRNNRTIDRRIRSASEYRKKDCAAACHACFKNAQRGSDVVCTDTDRRERESPVLFHLF